MMPNDWTEHNGGRNPVENPQLVEYRRRGTGDETFIGLSDGLHWGKFQDSARDIRWWRIAHTAAQPSPVESSAYKQYWEEMHPAPKHYDNHYSRPLTDEERATGIVRIKLDPYRVCDALNIGGGAREQIVKKGLRWTDKGDDERKVIKEIMQACERRLEMLEEDGK